MTQIKLNKDLECLIICSLRYCLPRNSYMPDLVARFIESNWDQLSVPTQQTILADIDGFYGESFAHKEPWNRIIALKIDDKKSSTI